MVMVCLAEFEKTMLHDIYLLEPQTHCIELHSSITPLKVWLVTDHLWFNIFFKDRNIKTFYRCLPFQNCC